MRTGAAFAAALVAVTAMGCAASPRQPDAAPGHPPSTRPATNDAAAAPTARTALALGRESTIALGHDTGPAAVDGDTLAYPRAASGGSWDRVVATSLTSGRSRVVARTGFPTGLVNWVALAGRWVVYVDQSAVQSDDPWELWARTGPGEPRLLRRGYYSSTWPAADAGDVAWVSYRGGLTVQSAADPGTRALAAGKGVRQVLMSDRRVVYITRRPAGDSAHVVPLPR